MKRFILLVIAATLCLGASKPENLGRFTRGAGSMTYTEYAPLADKPITLYYYIPTSGNVKTMPVLFAFHGAERSGESARNGWVEFAERDHFIILSPEFSRDLYDENAYQYGNVFVSKQDHTLNPEEKWVYSVVEPIFDFFKAQTGNKSKVYSCQGHSAGGQFTHRYLIAKPNARVDVAVASNPGTWTFLSIDGKLPGHDEDVWDWPYTLHGTPMADEAHIRAFLARDMVVHLGDADTLTSGKHVPTNKPALQEGKHRYDRGLRFYADVQRIANELGAPCRISQVTVGGVGHRGKGMIYARSFRDENNQRYYDINRIRKTGAYAIIYGERY